MYDIAEVCAQRGITQAVVCPGSRCAPLTLAFVRHPAITTRTFSDERSAGFVALGLAQQSKQPAVLVCTSGTAAYQFAPAIAEAFFSETPLVVFTADRPPEWMGQQDGQTIVQEGLYGDHVKRAFTLPHHYDHPDDQWFCNRVINEAIQLAMTEPRGPVHINAPFREPFYPAADEPAVFSPSVRVIHDVKNTGLSTKEFDQLAEELKSYARILVVAGQHPLQQELVQRLNELSQVTVVADVLSNLHGVQQAVRLSDAFLGGLPESEKSLLQPDLLITFGQSVISKNLKLFLRAYTPVAHWHIQPHTRLTDPFQSITKLVLTTPLDFFTQLGKQFTGTAAEFQNRWMNLENRAHQAIKVFLSQPEFGEIKLVHSVLQHLPHHSHLHLANSMSVRYANYVGLKPVQHSIEVHSNRGTSGIDGCSSTTVGHALASDDLHVLITGDLAFFYDRNAFWHNYALPNLRVVLLNNHGGIIFKLIDGPSQLREADPYFVTRQALTAHKLCEEFNFEYLTCTDRPSFERHATSFFAREGGTKIMELESTIVQNETLFKNFKAHLKRSYEMPL
jgi:2-succinyl-5-enolpyruvyl-6-hydroxy-3-cyclohexene-1-carboxylate synthase